MIFIYLFIMAVIMVIQDPVIVRQSSLNLK